MQVSNRMPTSKTWSLAHISRFRTVLMGIAALWIVWYHSDMRFDTIPPFYRLSTAAAAILHAVRSTGNAGVDIFLLLSGMGLYFSLEKSPGTLQFYKKRALRVLPPVLIVSAIWAGIDCGGGFFNYFGHVFLLNYFTEGKSYFWYVNLLLILYLIYPLLHRFLRKRGVWAAVALIAASLVLAASLYFLAPTIFWRFWFSVPRLPVFICGAYLGKLVYEKKEIPRRWLWGAAVFSAIFWLLTLYLHFRHFDSRSIIVLQFYLYCPLSLSTVLLCSAFFARFSLSGVQNVLAWFGGISLEIYLLYERVDMVCRQVFSADDKMHIVYYVPVFVTTILLSAALQAFCRHLTCTVSAPRKKADPGGTDPR